MSVYCEKYKYFIDNITGMNRFMIVLCRKISEIVSRLFEQNLVSLEMYKNFDRKI